MLDGEYTTPLSRGLLLHLPDRLLRPHGRARDRRVGLRRAGAPGVPRARVPGVPRGPRRRRPGVPRGLALIGQALLFGLGTLLLAFTVRDWWGPGVGLASAAVYALDPFSKHYVTILLSEQLAAFLVLAGVFAYTRAVRSRHLGWWAATGALAGSLTLVRAVFVFTVPLVIAAALLQRGSEAARRRCGARLRSAAARPLARLDEPHDRTRGVRRTGGRATTCSSPRTVRATAGRRRRSPRIRRSCATSSGRTGTRRRASSCSAIPRRTRATSRARTQRCGRRAVELYRDRLGDEPLQVLWENVYRACASSGRRTRTGTSRPAPRSSSCKRSTCSCSRWRSSASVLALRRGGPPRGVAVVLLALHRRDRDAPHRSAVRDAGARPLPRAHDVRRACAARAVASVAPPSRNVASQNGAVAGLPTDVMNDCVPPSTSPAANTPSAAAVTRRA